MEASMDIKDIKTQIKSNKLDNFYIFTGDEIKIQSIYCSKISEVSKKTIKRIDQVADIYKFKGNGLFATEYCYICQDDFDFVKAEKGWETILSMLGNHTLILLYSKLDMRSKFYKTFIDSIVTFNYVSDELLTKYIRKENNLAPELCKELIDICGSNYNLISLEMDKVAAHREYSVNVLNVPVSVDQSFKDLVDSGAIHKPPTDAIFNFVDAVLMGKPKTAFKLLAECVELGEPTLRLLLVLYTNARKVLQVQSCTDRDIEKVTGLSAWDIKCTRPKCGVYSNGELVNMLRLIHKLEQGIKQGRFDEQYAVDYLLVNIL